jgi:hypothetical protein
VANFSVERGLLVFAGIMVMISGLGVLLHHPYWAFFTVFIGFNCMQSAFTGFCPATLIMRKVCGMKTEQELAKQAS